MFESEAFSAFQSGVPIAVIAAAVRRGEAVRDSALRAMAMRFGVQFRSVRVPSGFEAMQAQADRMDRDAEEYVRDANRRIAAHLAAKPAAATAPKIPAVKPSPTFCPASLMTRVHEAGHAAVALHLGVRVDRVHADPDSGYVSFPHGLGRAAVNAAVSVAGIVATRVLAGDTRSIADFADGVDMQAFRASTENAFDEMRVIAGVEAIVGSRRAAIMRIAAALETKADLYEPEILPLYGG